MLAFRRVSVSPRMWQALRRLVGAGSTQEDEEGLRASIVKQLAHNLSLPDAFGRGDALWSTASVGTVLNQARHSYLADASLGAARLTVNDPTSRQAWQGKDRIKTAAVGLVLCLNIGVDPPDNVRFGAAATLECWQDPFALPAQQAIEAIGRALYKQYRRWSSSSKYTISLDPTLDNVQALVRQLRTSAGADRVLMHYNGHGVPRPTSAGELWVFNNNYTQYMPLSITDLQAWVEQPALFVLDCSGAGVLLSSFLDDSGYGGSPMSHSAHSRMGSSGFGTSTAARGGASRHGRTASGTPLDPARREWLVLAACGVSETLPRHPGLPADLFTACLTDPIRTALRCFVLENPHVLPASALPLLAKLPGKLTERGAPLGQLNWVFTAVTDTIAWHVLPRDVFLRLFRQDQLVATLYRHFLLACRIMPKYGCTPCSVPAMPEGVHVHPLWNAWDVALERMASLLPLTLKLTAAEMEEAGISQDSVAAVASQQQRILQHRAADLAGQKAAQAAFMPRRPPAGPWTPPPSALADTPTPRPTGESPKRSAGSAKKASDKDDLPVALEFFDAQLMSFSVWLAHMRACGKWGASSDIFAPPLYPNLRLVEEQAPSLTAAGIVNRAFGIVPAPWRRLAMSDPAWGIAVGSLGGQMPMLGAPANSSSAGHLPLLLQVMLASVRQQQGLALVAAYTSMGPWAVQEALTVGAHPYLLRILSRGPERLVPEVTYIWGRILAVDGPSQDDLVDNDAVGTFVSGLRRCLVNVEDPDPLLASLPVHFHAPEESIQGAFAMPHTPVENATAALNTAFVLVGLLRRRHEPGASARSEGIAVPAAQHKAMQADLLNVLATIWPPAVIESMTLGTALAGTQSCAGSAGPQTTAPFNVPTEDEPAEGAQQADGRAIEGNRAAVARETGVLLRVWMCILAGHAVADNFDALGQLWDSSLVDAVTACLLDVSPEVRAAAAFALGCFQRADNAHVPVLRSRRDSDSRSETATPARDEDNASKQHRQGAHTAEQDADMPTQGAGRPSIDKSNEPGDPWAHVSLPLYAAAAHKLGKDAQHQGVSSMTVQLQQQHAAHVWSDALLAVRTANGQAPEYEPNRDPSISSTSGNTKSLSPQSRAAVPLTGLSLKLERLDRLAPGISASAMSTPRHIEQAAPANDARWIHAVRNMTPPMLRGNPAVRALSDMSLPSSDTGDKLYLGLAIQLAAIATATATPPAVAFTAYHPPYIPLAPPLNWTEALHAPSSPSNRSALLTHKRGQTVQASKQDSSHFPGSPILSPSPVAVSRGALYQRMERPYRASIFDASRGGRLRPAGGRGSILASMPSQGSLPRDSAGMAPRSDPDADNDIGILDVPPPDMFQKMLLKGLGGSSSAHTASPHSGSGEDVDSVTGLTVGQAAVFPPAAAQLSSPSKIDAEEHQPVRLGGDHADSDDDALRAGGSNVSDGEQQPAGRILTSESAGPVTLSSELGVTMTAAGFAPPSITTSMAATTKDTCSGAEHVQLPTESSPSHQISSPLAHRSDTLNAPRRIASLTVPVTVPENGMPVDGPPQTFTFRGSAGARDWNRAHETPYTTPRALRDTSYGPETSASASSQPAASGNPRLADLFAKSIAAHNPAQPPAPPVGVSPNSTFPQASPASRPPTPSHADAQADQALNVAHSLLPSRASRSAAGALDHELAVAACLSGAAADGSSMVRLEIVNSLARFVTSAPHSSALMAVGALHWLYVVADKCEGGFAAALSPLSASQAARQRAQPSDRGSGGGAWEMPHEMGGDGMTTPGEKNRMGFMRRVSRSPSNGASPGSETGGDGGVTWGWWDLFHSVITGAQNHWAKQAQGGDSVTPVAELQSHTSALRDVYLLLGPRGLLYSSVWNTLLHLQKDACPEVSGAATALVVRITLQVDLELQAAHARMCGVRTPQIRAQMQASMGWAAQTGGEFSAPGSKNGTPVIFAGGGRRSLGGRDSGMQYRRDLYRQLGVSGAPSEPSGRNDPNAPCVLTMQVVPAEFGAGRGRPPALINVPQELVWPLTGPLSGLNISSRFTDWATELYLSASSELGPGKPATPPPPPRASTPVSPMPVANLDSLTAWNPHRGLLGRPGRSALSSSLKQQMTLSRQAVLRQKVREGVALALTGFAHPVEVLHAAARALLHRSTSPSRVRARVATVAAPSGGDRHSVQAQRSWSQDNARAGGDVRKRNVLEPPPTPRGVLPARHGKPARFLGSDSDDDAGGLGRTPIARDTSTGSGRGRGPHSSGSASDTDTPMASPSHSTKGFAPTGGIYAAGRTSQDSSAAEEVGPLAAGRPERARSSAIGAPAWMVESPTGGPLSQTPLLAGQGGVSHRARGVSTGAGGVGDATDGSPMPDMNLGSPAREGAPAAFSTPDGRHQGADAAPAKMADALSPRLPLALVASASTEEVKAASAYAKKLSQKAILYTGAPVTPHLLWHPTLPILVTCDNADSLSVWNVDNGSKMRQFNNAPMPTGSSSAVRQLLRTPQMAFRVPSAHSLAANIMMGRAGANAAGQSRPSGEVGPPGASGQRARAGSSASASSFASASSGGASRSGGTVVGGSGAAASPGIGGAAGNSVNTRRRAARVSDMIWINEQEQPLLCTAAVDGRIRVWRNAVPDVVVGVDSGEELQEGGGADSQWRLPPRGMFGGHSLPPSGQWGKQKIIASFHGVPDAGRGGSAASGGVVMQWQASSGRLVTAGASPMVRIWDMQREQVVGLARVSGGADTAVTCITSAWPGTGVVLLGKNSGTVSVLDTRMRGVRADASKVASRLREHKRWVVGLSQPRSGSGFSVVSGCVDGEVKLWDLRKNNSVRTIKAHSSPMTACVVHDWAPVIATGSTSQNIRLWKLDSLTAWSHPGPDSKAPTVHTGNSPSSEAVHPIGVLRYHEGFLGQRIGSVSALAFHPYNMLLASGATDPFVGVYATSVDTVVSGGMPDEMGGTKTALASPRRSRSTTGTPSFGAPMAVDTPLTRTRRNRGASSSGR